MSIWEGYSPAQSRARLTTSQHLWASWAMPVSSHPPLGSHCKKHVLPTTGPYVSSLSFKRHPTLCYEVLTANWAHLNIIFKESGFSMWKINSTCMFGQWKSIFQGLLESVLSITVSSVTAQVSQRSDRWKQKSYSPPDHKLERSPAIHFLHHSIQVQLCFIRKELLFSGWCPSQLIRSSPSEGGLIAIPLK